MCTAAGRRAPAPVRTCQHKTTYSNDMRYEESAPTRSVVHVAKLDPSKFLTCRHDKKNFLRLLSTTACIRAKRRPRSFWDTCGRRTLARACQERCLHQAPRRANDISISKPGCEQISNACALQCNAQIVASSLSHPSSQCSYRQRSSLEPLPRRWPGRAQRGAGSAAWFCRRRPRHCELGAARGRG